MNMYKQAIIVRNDLGLGKGKAAAQVSHASLSAYKKVEKSDPEIAREWEAEGQKKIVLKVTSEEELMQYFKLAKQAGIPCELIHDAGHTQVEAGTATCFGAGPWDEKELDKLFGKLKLF